MEEGGELGEGDKDDTGDDEEAEAMADDTELPADAEVLRKDEGNVGFLEDEGEVLETKDLEEADEAEEQANQKEYGRPVQP